MVRSALQRTAFAALLVAICVAAVSTLDAKTNDQPNAGRVTVSSPPMPVSSSGCSEELGAYAAAMLALEDAQEAANAAYQAWYECENGGGSQTEPNPITAEHSILSDK